MVKAIIVGQVREIVDFINKENISKEDIIQIVPNLTQYILVYEDGKGRDTK